MGIFILFTLLIALYLVMGIFLRPEALPGLLPQLSIWLIYAALFALLYLHVKRSGKATISETINLPRPVKLKKLVILSLIFTFASAIFTAEGVGLVIMVTPPSLRSHLCKLSNIYIIAFGHSN